jgi:hypothetical protein
MDQKDDKMLKFYARTPRLMMLAMLSTPLIAQADFMSDSEVRLDLKNFYLDRDSNGGVDNVGSWSQGADLQFISGFTETPVQFGLDLSATGAYVFDSEGNDGSLPYRAYKNDTADSYGRAGATLKFKVSETVLTLGDHRPRIPVAFDDTSRQLDTVFEGAMLQSSEWDGVTLTAGRFWEVISRESTDKEKLYLWGGDGSQRSDGLDFAGIDYQFNDQWSGSYYFGKLNDIYRQHYLGIKHTAPMGDGIRLQTDLRYFNNKESGDALYGEIDSRSVGAMSTFFAGNHMVALSVQKNDGDSFFPTMNGYVPQPYLVHWSSVAFVRPDEISYGIRYGYDFKDLGLPGFKLFARYIKGVDIDVGNETDGKESERDIYLSYEVQNETLKGLAFDLRNIHVNRSFTSDYDEFRFITTYSYRF